MSISYAVFCLKRRPPGTTLFPYTTLFRSEPDRAGNPAAGLDRVHRLGLGVVEQLQRGPPRLEHHDPPGGRTPVGDLLQPQRIPVERHRPVRSEEHTSELQSHVNLVCRLLLETPTTRHYTLSLHDALPI